MLRYGMICRFQILNLDVLVDFAEEGGLDGGSDEVLDLLASGPDILEEDILTSRLGLAYVTNQWNGL
tara:strand:+ start:946 stop:1146 length:201 start_codon:yes stop_codon:yes gene_type:complete